MIVKQFQCSSCEAEGKITVKGDDFKFEDFVYCPLCSGDIYEEEELDGED
jgi:excinuclease UvrABC ATPase subunit